MVLNTTLQHLQKQEDKNHKPEYMITYLSGATCNLCDLYSLWDLTNTVKIHFILNFKCHVLMSENGQLRLKDVA